MAPPDQSEFPAGPHLIQDFHKAIAGTPRAKIRLTTMTTEDHKVQITASIVALQRLANGPNPRTLEKRRVRHPPVLCVGSGRHDRSGTLHSLARCISKEHGIYAPPAFLLQVSTKGGTTAPEHDDSRYGAANVSIDNPPEQLKRIWDELQETIKPWHIGILLLGLEASQSGNGTRNQL